MITSNSAAVSAPRLPQHVVRDADLADVVQQRAQAHDLDVGGRQVELPADGDRQHADAVRVPGGVGIARVERRRQRADGARIRGLGLRLGLADRCHQIVERFRERIELAARPGQRKPRMDVVGRSHRGQRARKLTDRLAQRPGEPEAADAGEPDPQDADEREAAHRVAHRGLRRFVDRSERVEHRIADGDEPPERVGFAVERDRPIHRLSHGDRRLELPRRARSERGRHDEPVADDRDARAGEAVQFLRVVLVEARRDVQRTDGRVVEQKRHGDHAKHVIAHVRHAVEVVHAARRRARDERHRPVSRPAVRHPSGRPERHLAAVHEHDRVGLDACRHSLEHEVDRLQQIGAHGRAVGLRFGLICVERGFERGVVRQRFGLAAELVLASRFDGGKQPLRRFEIRRDRLPHLVSYAERHHDEDHTEKHSHGPERHRHRLDEQTGGTARPITASLFDRYGHGQVDRRRLTGLDADALGALADPLMPPDERVHGPPARPAARTIRRARES